MTTTWETLAAEAKYCPHTLAALCHVSLRTLQRRFDRTYGKPVGQWMRQVRLAQAYSRIAGGETVKSVAYDLHFKQLSHFSRVFKEVYGVAPTLISPRSHRKISLDPARNMVEAARTGNNLATVLTLSS